MSFQKIKNDERLEGGNIIVSEDTYCLFNYNSGNLSFGRLGFFMKESFQVINRPFVLYASGVTVDFVICLTAKNGVGDIITGLLDLTIEGRQNHLLEEFTRAFGESLEDGFVCQQMYIWGGRREDKEDAVTHLQSVYPRANINYHEGIQPQHLDDPMADDYEAYRVHDGRMNVVDREEEVDFPETSGFLEEAFQPRRSSGFGGG